MRAFLLSAPLINEIRELVTELVHEAIAKIYDPSTITSGGNTKINGSLLKSTHSIGTRKRNAQNIIESNSPSGRSIYSNPVVTLAPKSYNNRNTTNDMKNKIIYGDQRNSRQFVNTGNNKFI